MDRPKSLSAAFVKTVKTPSRYGDGRGGHGLSLWVRHEADGGIGKIWSQRLRIGGKPVNIGLGSFPRVPLALARARALENAQMVAAGVDPRAKQVGIPTFAEAAQTVIDIHASGWRNPRVTIQWNSSLESYVLPAIGHKPVSEISTADVLAVLVPILSKRETAKKVRQRISAIMKWSVAQGFRGDNPAGESIIAALPKNNQPVQHHPALPFAEVGGAVENIRASNAWPATKLCFEFLTLCACRSGEARLARWDEVPADNWTIPPERMKNKREHRIPLSRQAVAVLEQARSLSDGTGLIFQSPQGKALTDSTISKLVRENNIACVPHGMRSSFRDWAAECSDAPREIAEHALAHVEGSASERAYRRTDYFERRRALMQEWADYVLG